MSKCVGFPMFGTGCEFVILDAFSSSLAILPSIGASCWGCERGAPVQQPPARALGSPGAGHQERSEPGGAGLPLALPFQGRRHIPRGLPAAPGLGWHQGWSWLMVQSQVQHSSGLGLSCSTRGGGGGAQNQQHCSTQLCVNPPRTGGSNQQGPVSAGPLRDG